MKLTKEECEQALKLLISRGGDDNELMYWISSMPNEFKILMNLISEHFDIPPLTHEEIEEGHWYWHNKLKMWMKILNKDVCTAPFYVMENEYGYLLFEENCFYRKKVQE